MVQDTPGIRPPIIFGFGRHDSLGIDCLTDQGGGGGGGCVLAYMFLKGLHCIFVSSSSINIYTYIYIYKYA